MKILITAPFDKQGIEKLQLQYDVIYENWHETGKLEFDSNSLINRLNSQKIDIFVTEADEVDQEVIEKTNLKLIASTRGTPVNVDREAASAKKIPIIYAPHRNADAVADLTIAMMLVSARKLIQIDRFLKNGNFNSADLDEDEFAEYMSRFQGIELGNLTIGIIGFGAIGSRVAYRLYHGFGSKILYYDPYIPQNDPKIQNTQAQAVTLEDLMKNSDMITIHTPPAEDTDELIGEKQFALMKPTAYFFNLARSYCINENALYNAIKEKKIAGAGLDVFDQEPVDSENRFLEFDNVIVTPHTGGNTIDVIKHQTQLITDDIINFLTGKEIKNIWNTEINSS